MAYLGALIAPYILVFFMISAVLIVIVMLFFSIAEPIAQVGEAISDFISIFTGDDEYIDEDMHRQEL